MYKLTEKLKNLKPYGIVDGNFEIMLDANESFCDLNSEARASIAKEIFKINFNRYPDPYAKELIQTFAELYHISPENVVAGNGSDELISVICSGFLEKDDKILILSPDFSMYAFYGSLYELNVLTLDKQDDLSISVDRVIEYCKQTEISMLIFSNPCNPTSLGLSRNEVKRLLCGLDSSSCLVVLDEAYMDFWNENEESLLDVIADYDNLIILRTCSKAMGMAAVRLGFAVAGEKITQALKAAKSPYNINSVSQTIGKCLLADKTKFADNVKQVILQREELYNDLVIANDKLGIFQKIYNSNTNFVFLKTKLADEIYSELMKNSILIRKMGGYLRITAGTEFENAEVLRVLSSMKRGG